YWRQRDARALATREAFDLDAGLVWDWYRERRAAIRTSKPNPGHQALVALARRQRSNFLLVTQNVDDLDHRAGMPPERMVKIHGDIFISRCESCEFFRRDLDHDENGVPSCPSCGHRLRPGVVWFNEFLDPRNVERVRRFLAGDGSTTCLVVGTT